MFAASWVGIRLRRMRRGSDDAEHQVLGVVQGAALTLLALLIGFT
jgi:hypothetical protein